MRFVLCVVIAALLPVSALAQSGGAMSLSHAQALAAKGDQKAAAALQLTTDPEGCMNGCTARGHSKSQCVNACRPGLCHPGAEQPYCVSK